jgi:hypothetical protein
LDIALQKARQDLAMAAGAGPWLPFEKARRVAVNADQIGHYGPRSG